MARLLLISLALLLAALPADARRQRTTRGLKAAKSTAVVAAAPADTITAPADEIAISGYQKPLRARRETFFVSNRSSLPIMAVELRLTYVDFRGEQLHQRTEWAEFPDTEGLPPQESRLVSLPTWDVDNSFYFINGTAPRRKAIPYDIRIDPLRIAVPTQTAITDL